jgi:hypothetical protein
MKFNFNQEDPMSLAKYSRISIFCLVAALAFTACAKKNNDVTARRNQTGARDANTAVGQAADDQAKARGYDVQFVNFTAPVASGSALSVTTRISLNNANYDITTMHYGYGNGSAPATASQSLSGANFAVNAVCSNEYCNPYYIVINITANGSEIKQMGELKYFYYTGTSSQSDVFFSKPPGQFVSLQQAMNELAAASQQIQ